MLRKILIRIGILLLLVAGLNVIYTHTFFEKDLKEKSNEALQIRETQSTTDIYYFGESSNVTYAPGDTVKSSISELTGVFFPSLKITNINKNATHGGIYKYWLNEIHPGTAKPAAIVITLNLRSFDASWIHSTLETQLQEGIVLTRPYPNILNRFLLSLQAFDTKTDQQREQEIQQEWRAKTLKFPFPVKYSTVAAWDYATSQGAFLKPDGSWDSEKIILACHYIKSYAFNLEETNPRIRDFDDISEWCAKNQVNLYLNLMAENIEYADSLVGKELVFLMRQNRDYLVKRYTKGNCKVIDNLERVKGKEFIDQNWTTEHYNEQGRKRIAKNLATNLKTQFNKEFKSAY